MATWIWLSGFASDMGIWDDDLSRAAPDAAHTFIPFSEIIGNPDDLYASIPDLAAADVVVGWDVGGLGLLRSRKQRPAGQKWVLLAPAVNLCTGEDGWPPRDVLMMARQIVKNPRGVIDSFLELMGPCEESIQESWVETAVKMPSAPLAKGLEYLASTGIEEPIALENTDVYFGKEDQWVTPALAAQAKPLLPGAVFHERAKSGHWAHTLLL